MALEKRVAIAGVSGFIGHSLPGLLAPRGMAVTGISRSPGKPMDGVKNWQTYDSLDLSGHHAVINLAGARVDQRWTEKTRREIHDSRIGPTRKIVEAIASLPEGERPAVLVNGSATGFYGDRGDEILTESSAPGADFLADVCRDWEAAAMEAGPLGVRVVRLRTGVVLGKEGAAFKKLRLALGTGLGGKLGTGRQWMPWIHIDDLRAAIVHALFSESLDGPVNGTAPAPERNVDLTKKFAAVLHRPAVIPVPAFALKLALGGFASALLGGQRAIPAALEADDFEFRFPDLESALSDLVG